MAWPTARSLTDAFDTAAQTELQQTTWQPQNPLSIALVNTVDGQQFRMHFILYFWV